MDKDKKVPTLSKTAVMQSVILPSELRIGNLLRLGNSTCRVYEINGLNFYVRNERRDESLKSSWAEIEPILLTDEWLFKFNFEIKKGKFGNEYWGQIILYTSEKGNVCFLFENYLKDVFFVHELQNLYFALTGHELTVA